MEKRGRLRYLVPILVIGVIVLAQPNLPQASFSAFTEIRSGEHTFRELGDLLPEGIDSLIASAPWDTGAMLLAHTNVDGPALARYNAAQGRLEGGLVSLPPYFASSGSLARSGPYLLYGGDSLGTSPVLGLYDAVSQRIDDVSDVLPAGMEHVSLIVGGDQSFLMIGHNGTGYTPGIFEPGPRSWRFLAVGAFANLTSVRHGTWNGTAFYVAGEKLGGVPALLQVDAAGVVDLSDGLPNDMVEANHLVWTGTSLFVLGWRHFSVPRASMAVYVPETGVTVSLTSSLRSDFTGLRSGVWNGTSLILQAEVDSVRILMAYYPANDTSLYVDDVLPSGREYQDMIQYRESILIAGDDGSPFIGHLGLSDWSWEEKEGAFEGRFQTILHAQVAGDSVVVAGARRSSAALALVDVAAGSLEDRSGALGLADTTILGTAGDEDWLLIAGRNKTGGGLYGYSLTNGTLKDLTSKVPEGVDFGYHPSRVDGLYAIPGLGDGGSALLVYDLAADEMTDLSAQVRHYFDPPIGLAPGDDEFLIFGHNDRGPALAVLDVETMDVTPLGRQLASLYGPSGILLSGAWSGDVFLIGGTVDGRPLVGRWEPVSDAYLDLSRGVPEDFGIVTAIEWAESGFVVGGQGLDGASIGAVYPRNGSFVDLRQMLPPHYAAVSSIAAKGDEVLIVSTLAPSGISIGVLRLGESSTLLGGLPALISEPAGATVLGLSVALAAAVAYLLGRRTRPPKFQQTPLPQPYPETHLGPPEKYLDGYPEDFEAMSHWYNW